MLWFTKGSLSIYSKNYNAGLIQPILKAYIWPVFFTNQFFVVVTHTVVVKQDIPQKTKKKVKKKKLLNFLHRK